MRDGCRLRVLRRGLGERGLGDVDGRVEEEQVAQAGLKGVDERVSKKRLVLRNVNYAGENLAEETSRALRLATRLSDQAQLTRHLETAMASRSVID